MSSDQTLENEIHLTKHAKKRMRQRGFNDFIMNIIQQYGRCESAPDHATKIFFGNKERQEMIGEFKRAIQLLDRAKDGTLIMAENEVLTVYNKN